MHRSRIPRHFLGGATLSMAESGSLEPRLTAILDSRKIRAAVVGRPGVAVIASAIVAVVSLAFLQPSFSQEMARPATEHLAHRVSRTIYGKRASASKASTEGISAVGSGHLRPVPLNASARTSVGKRRTNPIKFPAMERAPHLPGPAALLSRSADNFGSTSPDKTLNTIVMADAEDSSPLAVLRQKRDIANVAMLTPSTKRLGERPIGEDELEASHLPGKGSERPVEVVFPSGPWATEDVYTIDAAHPDAGHVSKGRETDEVSGPQPIEIKYGAWTHTSKNGALGYSITVTQTTTANGHEIVFLGRDGKTYWPDSVTIKPYFILPNRQSEPLETTIWMDEKNLPFDKLSGVQVNCRPITSRIVVMVAVDVQNPIERVYEMRPVSND